MAGSKDVSWKLGLAALVVVGLLCFAPSAVATSPALAAPQASLEQECLQAGLVMPTVRKAYVAHAGKRPYEKGPRDFGHVQQVVLKVRYPDVREECDGGFIRVGHLRLEKEVAHNKWRKLSTGYPWTVTLPSNKGLPTKATEAPVNESYPDWYYWHPGQRFRGTMVNEVKDLASKQVLGSKTELAPIPIRGHRSARRSRAFAARARSSRVSWTLPQSVSEGQPIAFSWSASGSLGRKHRLVVQRQVGTAHSWQSVMRLRGRSGSAELPGLPLGRYRLRIADLVGRGRVLTKQVSGIGVFGQVPFTTLFNASESHSYATPTATFPYVAYYYDSNGNPAFTVEHNHCNFVRIAFVAGKSYKTYTATVKLVQESRDPVSVSVPTDSISELNAELVPGQSWSVDVSTTGGEATYFINGYAVCSSAEGFLSEL
ncbi:MAG TPA: hypothetical protein VF245_02485 [Solirubrobacterales bacterium]